MMITTEPTINSRINQITGAIATVDRSSEDRDIRQHGLL